MEVVKETLHGVELSDPYRWLENQNSPATRSWIKTQNDYSQSVLGKYPGRPALLKRAEELFRVDSQGMPTVRGGKYFFSRRTASQDLPVICMSQSADAAPEVLIDPKQLSVDGTKTVSLMEVSRDGTLLFYGIRSGGEDEVAVRLFDVQQRKDLDWQLPRGRYFGLSLTPDKQTLFYTRHDKAGSRVLKVKLQGDPAGNAETVFGEGYDPGVIVSPSLSENGRYLLMHVFYGSAGKKTDVYFQDLQAGGPVRPLVNDLEARFIAHAVDQRVFLRTNWEAPRGRLLKVDLTNPDRSQWKEIIPTEAGVMEDVTAAGGKLYVNSLRDVKSVLTVYEENGQKIRDIQFPGLGSVSGVAGDWDQPEAFYAFSSFHIPSTIYREQVATGEQTVWSRLKMPVDSDQFQAEQVFYPSKDGTKIPMFLVYRKGLLRNGQNPTLLYGYGGFNNSLTPGFSSRAVMWMEQGGVYAVANLRGGGEYGEEWHLAGMQDRKQNTFDDFEAAARWLIEQKYTSPAKLAIQGGSNGGLLVGAAMTQHPELYRAVICSYPLLDMVRYHQFLVARFWIPEYGSSEDPVQFKTLLAYSPYHHVKPGTEYPAALFITGDADTRVDPLHARKMAALLQSATGSAERPVLLKYDTKLGHTGARPVSQSIIDLVDELSFLMQELSVSPPPATQKETAARGAATQPGTATQPGNAVRPVQPVVDGPEDKRLNALFDREWQWGLKESPTFASFLGDPRYNDLWPDVSLPAIERRHQHQRELLKELAGFDPAQLNRRSQLNLRLFKRQLTEEVQEYAFRTFLIPLNQREGIQDESSQADALDFSSVKHYDDWLARLNRFPQYMEQTIALMKQGIAEKRLQPKVVMDRLPTQIRRQIVDDPTKSLYFKPFLTFEAEIPAADQDRLKEAAQTAIRDKIVPAYKEFLRFFENEYLPACYTKVGAWQMPNGLELYAFKARQFTTTELTPDQIHTIGLEEVRRIRGEMEEVIRQTGFQGNFAQFLEHLRTDKKFYYDNPQDLLNAYLAVCKRVDPHLTKLFRKLPRTPYGVEPIPEHMAPDTTTAYYRPPAADGSRAGTYFVNLYRPEVRPKYEIEALSLHEAVPGHHLQIALANELDSVPEFRKHAGFTAYVEGWALYSERLGSELGLYKDPYSRFGQLTYEMWRAVRLVVDTGLHSKHWTRQQAIDFFKENAGKAEHDIINEVDRYIAWPGQALAYKIGELKIRELRKRCEQALGERFDVRDFHDLILSEGAVPLDVLEEMVHDWLTERGVR